jgi:hypothetical protein
VSDSGYPGHMSTHEGQAPDRGRPAPAGKTAGGERGGRTVEEWNRIDRGEADEDPLDKSGSTTAGAATEPPD